ncbi:MAG: hypothetical protein QOF92_597 [Pseudonocardiales bacterium]|jgi:hypothetical protein|nr:hypothetical protein [Jatrophihabitans sp.]MDT4902475.1 hypothetical protein [Pseudonocardiales bacterium]MDT4927730.1 hypothetical protein [Pseudonocardiales bacterium]
MDDKSMLEHINDLVTEEKKLRAAHHPLTAEDRTRLEKLELELDQYWDLLRQRRAREEFGEDPEAAKPRTVNEVEGYLQ